MSHSRLISIFAILYFSTLIGCGDKESETEEPVTLSCDFTWGENKFCIHQLCTGDTEWCVNNTASCAAIAAAIEANLSLPTTYSPTPSCGGTAVKSTEGTNESGTGNYIYTCYGLDAGGELLCSMLWE